ncbi:MAG: hypothetical protein AAF364_18555 [Pseudomonadota bacterium]
MMKVALLKTHYTSEEAYSILMLLDELRDTIWQNYREEVIEYCHQQTIEDEREKALSSTEFYDDLILF